MKDQWQVNGTVPNTRVMLLPVSFRLSRSSRKAFASALVYAVMSRSPQTSMT